MDEREQKLRNQQQRGRQAKDVLDNPVVQKAFEDIEQKVIDAWKNASVKDEELITRCKYVMEATKSFREYFTDYVLKGENAKKELLNLEKTSKLNPFK